MRLPGRKYLSDLLDEDSLFLFREMVFTLLWRVVRIEVFQFLRCNESNVVWEDFSDVIITACHIMLRLFQSCVNFADRIFQCLIITLFFGNHFFPVPLIHIDRVKIVGVLVPADRAHISVKSLARVKAVALQCIAFPFCK